MKIKVLDSLSFGSDTPIHILNELGDLEVYESSNTDETVARCADADVIVLNKTKITREVIYSSETLRLICVFATGFDNIDIKAAKERGVAVCNVPGYSTESVALYTLTTVLALYTHILEYNAYVRDGSYTRSGVPNKLTPVYHELGGKKWGIIGYGNIGKEVARLARAFGAEIIVNKRTPEEGVEICDLDTLCRECDIITIHCPLNDESRGIIDERRLNLMKPEVVLVNEARGAVLDEAAVAQAVKEGRIGAFGCDVYSQEPFPSDHPYASIKELENVLLTPHAAWGSYEARSRCIGIISENIKAFVDGKIKNRVDI